ncbi:hypothetical protein X949_5970 [Burkholderia pseudomallei MSHR5609]|nr:hypothetical protein X949_5970 [Burkholderia pseudomallei MSHR5609]
MREICRFSLSAASDKRCPGAKLPCTMLSRICSVTRSATFFWLELDVMSA